MFKAILSPQARRDIKQISKSQQRTIRLAISELKDDPFSGKPLTRELTNRFTYKVGVYRIIYRTNKQTETINIVTVGHRSTVYN